MSLTDDEEEKVRFMISELDTDAARKCLNKWELSFLGDQIKRYDEFGSQMSLSPKQWSVLNSIYEKATGID